jgi:hypothetical protein
MTGTRQMAFLTTVQACLLPTVALERLLIVIFALFKTVFAAFATAPLDVHIILGVRLEKVRPIPTKCLLILSKVLQKERVGHLHVASNLHAHGFTLVQCLVAARDFSDTELRPTIIAKSVPTFQRAVQNHLLVAGRTHFGRVIL